MKSIFSRDALAASMPYVAWMVLMFALPQDFTLGYLVRSVLSAALLIVAYFYFARKEKVSYVAIPKSPFLPAVIWGLVVGFVVTVLWVAPEYLHFYRDWCIIGDVPNPCDVQSSPYNSSLSSKVIMFCRLAGSAFIIAPAEELFFRFFLYRRLIAEDWYNVDRRKFDISAFLWMVGLFALEHNRFVAAVVAGVAYGFVYMRSGLFAAILAHVLTNLLLGLYVIYTGTWGFW